MRIPSRGTRAPGARGPRLLLAVGAAALALAAALVASRSLGPSAPKPSPEQAPGIDAASGIDTVAFRQLRPRNGDHMAPPRIGFRWSFPPDSVGADGVRFRLHIQGPDGVQEITRETGDTHLNVDLAPSFPLGECEWWVEAIRPGKPGLRSKAERFRLEP